MRPEKLYLTDIVEAADAIARFLDDVEQEDFLKDELRQSAVLQKLTTIGEAAARLPDDFQQRHPEFIWRHVIGFRNIAVHEYFSINWEVVWVTATLDVPLLREKIAVVLAAEYSEQGSTDG
jgi:uncharacterized protein with HEPN domain